MKTVAIIAARMDSSRLPGKVMMPILGKPMIERMIERIQFSKHINEIIIATTELLNDDILASLAKKLHVGCFRGAVDDVLGRLHAAAYAAGTDHVVDLLGDNPLVHADLIDDVIEFYHSHDFDYAVSTTTEHPYASPELARFPIGIRVEMCSREVLDRCEKEANNPYHREHSASYIYEHLEIFKIGYFEAKGKWAELNRPELTFAVNYRENFDLVSYIFEKCYSIDPNFTLQAVLKTFDSNPELLKLMGAPAVSSNV